MKIGNTIVLQKPNKVLFAAIALWLVARLSHGPIHDYASGLFIIVMLVWSSLEIAYGVNIFRRVLGLVVGLMMLYSAYKMFLL